MDPEPTVGELPEPASQPQRLRVLIADDERDTLVTLGLLCRDEGMEARLVTGGAQVPAAVAEFGPGAGRLAPAMPDRAARDIAAERTNRYGARRSVPIATAASCDAAG